MTGSLLLRREELPIEPYTRIRFRLEGGLELRFTDPRKFGHVLAIDPAGEERPLPLSLTHL